MTWRDRLLITLIVVFMMAVVLAVIVGMAAGYDPYT